MEAQSKVNPSNTSMKSSPIILPSELRCLTVVSSVNLSSAKIQSSQTISAPRRITCMEDDSSKLQPFRWQRPPEASANTTNRRIRVFVNRNTRTIVATELVLVCRCVHKMETWQKRTEIIELQT